MKRPLDGWIWVGLGISLLTALLISPFASSSPDGLETVAEVHGFKGKSEGWSLRKYAPLADYVVPRVRNKKVSTALSGLLGTVSIFSIAFGLGKLLKKSANSSRRP